MKCPKCNKETCVLVTERNKKKVREFRGLFWWTLGLPIRLFMWLWRILFERKEKYYETPVWSCNYCGNKFKDKPEE